MREMRYATGGFYFKDRIGEQIANSCWNQIRQAFPGDNEDRKSNYFRSVRLLEDRQDVDELLEKLDETGTEGPLRKTWVGLETLLANEDQATKMMAHFNLLRAIVVYESNRVYAHWYRLPEPITLTPEQEKLAESLFGESAKQELVRKYIKLGAK